MKALLNNDKSIYLQISESIEDDILTGVTEEEQLVPSTNQIAKFYSINPATAAKGVNLLVDEEIIYKKRGIGMCVKKGAREKILNKRKKTFYSNFVISLMKEANKLGLTKNELINMIEKGEINE